MQVSVTNNNGIIAETIDGGEFHVSGDGISEWHSQDNRQVTLCEGDVSAELLAGLKGIFYGKEDVALRFLNEIAGTMPKHVIEQVGRYLEDGELSQLSCHRDLWRLLHENGYYAPSESNWNKAICKL